MPEASSAMPNHEPQPLRPEDLKLVSRVVAALEACGTEDSVESIRAIKHHLQNLVMFGELLNRYPSPLTDQVLHGKKRGLETLVDTMVLTDQATFPFRAPTQALVGRTMNMAQINFLRMLWHLVGSLPSGEEAAKVGCEDAIDLREAAARRLRGSVHTRLVEEVLADIVTDASVERKLRAQGVRSLAHLWGNRLTWRVHDFFPILEATWEARQRVRVIGGSLAGSCELMQLMTKGGDAEFVDLFTNHDYGTVELDAFREFLFGTSSEELDRLAQRMASEGLTSIELDSRIGEVSRDVGSILFEFFRARLVQCSARRVANLPGPRHTAEGYVMLAWLEKQCS
tara:strand:+ start:62500 stop:63522 length:1023 start_codon:yes stop_codon:yes gene_type:complete